MRFFGLGLGKVNVEIMVTSFCVCHLSKKKSSSFRMDGTCEDRGTKRERSLDQVCFFIDVGIVS